MSRTIDEYVASMQFDNKNFERNVNTSLKTLDRLKQNLNLTGAAKGLENIDTTAKNMNFSGLSSGIESVRMKFSALQVMAVTALSNITNSAVNAGKKLASVFTIEPIKAGFQEYETQIGAVQTILANTQHAGTDINDVNAALDELNKYADQTIYNFTEMTRNIGTFTAAGVDLDKSVQSIKGIANLAAVSGSTSQQASTAMYQLSQALAAGKVSLMDWNSVVNAGMGGKVFQDALVRTSELLKTGAKDAIATYGSFRESLTQGEWLTTEVLTETLAQLSGAYTEADLIAQGYTEAQAKEITELADTAVQAATKVKTFTQLIDTLKEATQSGWTQTWELLIGDFEQAKELWSGASDTLGDLINKSSESRNKLLAGALESNWDRLTDKISEAGVESKTFENKVKEVAAAHKIDVDKLIEQYGSLGKAIQAGKIPADILKESLDKVGVSAADLSKISRNLKFDSVGEDVKELQTALKDLGYDLGKKGVDGIIGQYTEDAIKAFQMDHGLEVTGIVDEKTLTALKEATDGVDGLRESCSGLIDEIDKLGGRDLLIQSIKNIFDGLMKVLKPIGVAFRDVFPPMTSEKLLGMIEGFHELTEKMKPSMATIRKIHSTFKGLFSVVDIGWTFVKQLAGGLVQLLGSFKGLGSGVLGITGSIGDWLSGLRDSVKESNIFGEAIDNIVGFLGKAIDKIKEFGSFLKGKIVAPGWEGFLNLMSGIWDIVLKVGSKISEIGAGIGSMLSAAFETGDISTGLDILNGGLFAGVLIGVKNFFKNLNDAVGDGMGLFDNIKEVLGGVKDSLETWQQSLKSDIIRNIAISIGILAASLFVLGLIDEEKIAGALGAISVLFADLMGSLALFTKMDVGGLSSVGKAVGAMMGISVAVLILASALKKISDLGWEGLAQGLVGIVALTATIVIATKALATDGKEAVKGATQMVIFAAAIKILASACRDLSSLSWKELAKGLVGVGVLMAEIAIFLKVAKFSGQAITTATGIVILAAAIKILASACTDFGSMSWSEIGKGLASIGLLLAEIAIFTRLTGNAKNVASTGAALIMIGAAMKIFTSAVTDFASMSWDEIGRGLAALAGALLSVAIAVRIMPTNMLGMGAGILIMSAALLVLTEALSRMGGMTWDEIGRGLATLGGSILILAIGLNVMNGTLPGAAALIVAAGALAILTPVLKTLGSMSIGEIVKGLIAMAGAFAVIGIAGLLLAPLVPTILSLSAAFALIGFSVLAVGIGLAAVAFGLTALATAGTAGATAIVAALTIIVTGIANLIPVLAQKFGEAIVVFCQVIGDSATAIGEAIVKVLFAIMDTIEASLPRIVDFVFNVLIAVMDGLTARLPELIQSAVDLLTALFSGIADAIMSISPGDLAKTAIGVGIAAGLMAIFNFVGPLVPGAMTGVLGMAAVVAEIGVLLAAFGALAQIPGLQWLIGEGGEMLQTIGNSLGKFVGGLVGGIAEGFTASLPQIATDLSNFMTNLTPFIDGAKQIDESMLTGVKSLVEIITTLTKANVIDGIASWITGESSLTKFATELVPFGTAIKNFAAEVAGLDETAVIGAANAGKALTEMASTIPNTGGLVAFFAGENDMTTFGTQLKSFGTAIKDFATEVTGLNTAAIQTAASAGSSLVSLANTIPNTGGLVAFFAGDNDMVTFATQLKAFGTGIKEFATEVAGLDTESVNTAVSAGMTLSNMANALPESGGLWSVFTADNDMSTFAKEIKKFGEGISNFSEEVSGINTSAVDSAAGAGLKLAKMAEALPEGKTLDRIGTLGKKIKDLGGKLKDFADNVSDVTASKFTDIANGLSKLSKIKIDNADAIQSFVSSLGKISTEGIDKFAASFKDAAPKVIASVNAMLTLTAQAVRNKGTVLKDAFKDVAAACPPAMKSTEIYTQLQAAGKYLVQGFASGISANTYLATAKAVAMANAAKQAAKNALKINSPSKVFIPIGKSVPEGFAKGIESMGNLVKGSVVTMTDNALNNTKKAMSRIVDVINSDMDTQPTIRPVIDLSDISAGVSKVNSLMSNITPSSRVMATVNSIGSTIGKNASSSDSVISAIKDLKKGLNVKSGDTYNINGITYDDGSNVSSAVKTLVRAARMESRV